VRIPVYELADYNVLPIEMKEILLHSLLKNRKMRW
jgi:hypothetical protein